MARHDAERRKLATEPEREGNRVAHAKLTGHHLVTAEKILSHPASHNVEWHDAAALLAEIGSITEGSNGRFTVTLGDETQVFDRPAARTSILNRSWISKDAQDSRLLAREHSRVSGDSADPSRFTIRFLRTVVRSRHEPHRASLRASLNSLPADITGSPMPIRTAPG